MLDSRKANIYRKKLERYLKDNFSHDQIEQMTWKTDIETENSLTWRFNLGKSSYELTCQDGKVELSRNS